MTVGDFDNDGHPDLFLTRWRSLRALPQQGRRHVRGRHREGRARGRPRLADLGGLRRPRRRRRPRSLRLPLPRLGQRPPAPLLGQGPQDLRLLRAARFPLDARPPLPQRRRAVRRRHGRGRHRRHGRARASASWPATSTATARVDLFVANDQSAKFLFLNRGGLRFEEVGHLAGVASNDAGVYTASMGVACGDLDGDGLPDLAVTNFYNEYTAFYQNLGERRLQRPYRGIRPRRAQPLSAGVRDRLPRFQQRRPARPGHGQRPRRRPPDRTCPSGCPHSSSPASGGRAS